MANAGPAMPSLAEEEDLVIEFGDNKLHEQAAISGANLAPLFKENFNIAVRNSQFKTAREKGLGECVDHRREVPGE